jgi:hypothetical protein
MTLQERYNFSDDLVVRIRDVMHTFFRRLNEGAKTNIDDELSKVGFGSASSDMFINFCLDYFKTGRGMATIERIRKYNGVI